jgi:hypothetical protein
MLETPKASITKSLYKYSDGQEKKLGYGNNMEDVDIFILNGQSAAKS